MKINEEFLIGEIDNRLGVQDFLNLEYQLVLNYTENRKKAEITRKNINLAIRWIFLLDYHYETNNKLFYKEAQKYKEFLFKVLDKKTKANVERGLITLFSHFKNEKKLIKKIREGDYISENRIKKHLEGKSSDSFIYSKILESQIMRDLSDPFHLYTMLFDIKKDILDYETDFENQPNILSLFLIANREEIPKKKDDAISLSKKLSVSAKIIDYSNKLFALVNQYNLPLLTKRAKKEYREIKNQLF